MNKHGGTRKNAGRKKKLPANFKRKQIAVTSEMFDELKKIENLQELTLEFWAKLICS